MAASLQPSATFPPVHANRTIVLCFDGTQNQIGDNLSNVAKFFSLLERGDPSRQLVYYQTGIGTYTSSSMAKGPISSRIAMTLDSMFATSIEVHVQEGYRYLMDNYLAGDHICIFGFSRGAYTARALAAMLHKVGLLQRGNHRHIRYAWKAYTLTSEEGWKRAGVFKRCFGMEVDIEFIGVWDSVGSLGLNRFLPLTTSNTRIKAVRHALALDERRARFKANVWDVILSKTENQSPEGTPEITPPANTKGTRRKHRRNQADDDERRLLAFGARYIPTSGQQLQTDVLEVWFAGCHSDVGGGNTPTDARHALSRIPLRWMVRQCFLVKTGILFKEASLRKLGLDPYGLYPRTLTRPPPVTDVVQANKDGSTPSEEEEDLLDLRCSINDQLKRKPAWWILEVIPARKKYRTVDGAWGKRIEMNLGKPRDVHGEGHGLFIHRTVKQKMEFSEYKPKAHLEAEPHWVD